MITCLLALKHFLELRNFLKRNFNAHISARNHNSVRNAQNFIDILNSFFVLDFRDKADIGAVFLGENFADFEDIVRAGYERSGDVIKAFAAAEAYIRDIDLA